jgi:AraC-like DNA-binding protein
LVLVKEGACVIKIDDTPVHCPAGTFCIVPPDTLHMTTNSTPAPVFRYSMHFDWEYQRRVGRLGYCVDYPHRLPRRMIRWAPPYVPRGLMAGPIRRPGDVMEIAERVCHQWTSSDVLETITLRAALLEILIILLTPDTQRRAPNRRSKQLAQKAHVLLSQTIPQTQSIRNMLRGLGYSYEHICRIFRQTYGLSPVAFVNAFRIRVAKRLLADQRHTVKEVAHLVGLNNPHYFARMFRVHCGLAPSVFRSKAGHREWKAMVAKPPP